MSFRSGANSDLVLRNLTVDFIDEVDFTNLEVIGDTSLNTLDVSGDATNCSTSCST